MLALFANGSRIANAVSRQSEGDCGFRLPLSITRRHVMLVLGAGALVTPFALFAEEAGRVFQIGYLGNSTPEMESALVEAFRRGLRERGYTEGKNIIVHYRWAGGKIDRFPVLIDELLALKVDVLLTSGTPGTLAAMKATTTVPIVMAAAGDAVGTRLVESLARPGGNVTGLSTLYIELEGKRLQVLRQLVPKLTRLALLTNPANPFTQVLLKSTRAAADKLHISPYRSME